MTRRSSRFAAFVAFAAAAVVALATGVASAPGLAVDQAAPSPFEVVIDGSRRPAGPPEKFFAGFRHEGSFTASLPFCPAGYAVDLEWLGPLGSVRGKREFSCRDGSGSITARQRVLRTDLTTYLEGDWRIFAGTGAYAALRGKGTFVTAMTGDDFATRKIHETWRGLAGFDDVSPTIAISQSSTKRLRRPKGTYSVRIAFLAQDGSEGTPVSYRMTVRSGSRVLASRSGTTSATASITFRVRPRKNVRSLRIVIVASDVLGNESTVSRLLKLPS